MPVLWALPSVPAGILAGGVYVITQGSGGASINESLAANLTSQPWAEAVSPELLVFGSLAGEPVLVRGADPAAFLALEGGRWVQGGAGNRSWAVAGEGLQQRSSLALGEPLTLIGSSVPRIAIATLTGVYRTDTPANDELIVDFDIARFLTDVSAGAYHSIRVRTSDPSRLVAFLEAVQASVVVSGPRGPIAGVNTEPSTDPRVINLLLLHGQGSLPSDYLSEGIAEATNSIRIVAWGLAALVLTLVVLGVHALQARSLAERRGAVGVLRTLGARGSWVAARAAVEMLPLAVLAGVLGAAVGFVLSDWSGLSDAVLVAGHVVRVAFDPGAYLSVVLAIVAASVTSELVLVRAALKERPGELLREERSLESPVSLEVVLRS